MGADDQWSRETTKMFKQCFRIFLVISCLNEKTLSEFKFVFPSPFKGKLTREMHYNFQILKSFATNV